MFFTGQILLPLYAWSHGHIKHFIENSKMATKKKQTITYNKYLHEKVNPTIKRVR